MDKKIEGNIIKMTEEDLTIVTIDDDGIETFSVYLKDDICNFGPAFYHRQSKPSIRHFTSF